MKEYCLNCGAQLEEDAAFCDVCGTPVERRERRKVSAARPERNQAKAAAKPKKLNKGLIAVIAVLAVILIGVAVICAANANTVNVNKYAHIEFEGYNGYGRPVLVIDTNGITKDYGSKMQGAGGYMSAYFDAGSMFRSDCISGKFNKTEGLSNGDKVTLHWTCNDGFAQQGYGLKMKYSDMTVKVKGLENVETFDPFANLTVSFEGYSGYGKINVDGGSEDIRFKAESDGSLSNGDKAVVRVDTGWSSESEYVQQYMNSCGRIPSPMSKEYTVSGLEEPQTFDPFDYITVSVSGVSGKAEVGVSVDRTQAFMQELEAYASKSWNVRNGDLITVTVKYYYYNTAEMAAEMAKKYGMIPSRLEKTYEVMELNEYVTDASQIASSSIDAMCTQMNDIINSQVATWSSSAILNRAEYLGCYVLSNKGESKGDNHVIPVYRIDVTISVPDEGINKDASYYYAIDYTYVSADPDGVCTFGNYSKITREFRFDISSLRNPKFSGYQTLTELYNKMVGSRLEYYTASHVGELP